MMIQVVLGSGIASRKKNPGGWGGQDHNKRYNRWYDIFVVGFEFVIIVLFLL